MNGRNVSLAAFELRESPRVPVTLIGGGSWYVHWAGKTFAGIKNDPQQISDIFVRAVREIGHDLLWTGSNFINYPIHLLGCDIQDDSSDGPVLLTSVIDDLAQKDSLDMQKVVESPLMQGILRSHHLVADQIGKETRGNSDRPLVVHLGTDTTHDEQLQIRRRQLELRSIGGQ